MAVLTYHVWLYRLPNPNKPTREDFLDYLLFEWRIGLVVFFVMSGYLLYRPLLKGGHDSAPRMIALGQYYWRRIVRIVPAYYLAIIGFRSSCSGGSATRRACDCRRPTSSGASRSSCRTTRERRC